MLQNLLNIYKINIFVATIYKIMKGKKLLLFLGVIVVFQFLNSVALKAQSSDIFNEINNADSVGGEITLYQDASLNVLIDKYKRITKKNLKGYRIQIYRGLGQEAREKANLASQKFINEFTDFDPTQIYAIYESPYFKLRIGDFRTKNEAFEILYQVKEIFPDAYIVNSKINYPKLSAEIKIKESYGDE